MADVVIIHASLDDDHSKAVAECLRKLQVDVCVLFRENCFVDWSINCHDDDIVIQESNKQWSINNIRSVYWRRDFLVEPDWIKWDGAISQVKRFLAEQRSIHVESAFKRIGLTKPFINDISTNRKCSSKALQHYVARTCGLLVPDTYIGSNSEEAKVFAQNLWSSNRRCCTKNLESSHLEIDGRKHARMTNLFLESNINDLQGLPAGPMIFQEYIEKKYEYRVTVIGQEVYACRIDSQVAGGDTAIDWRHYNITKTPHFAVELETTLKEKLIKFVFNLGLTYGAIDLIESLNGQFYLLEINSMGQWLWIEDLTELPISNSIAKHLAEPHMIRR